MLGLKSGAFDGPRAERIFQQMQKQ